MGAYLRTLRGFHVEAVQSTEDVLTDGQKVQFLGTSHLVVRLPDRLRASTKSDRRDRLYLYDGKQFTLYARRANMYAQIQAPPTLTALSDVLENQYGLEIPLVDLFKWGGPNSQEAAITSAMAIGPSEIGGVSCGHYAFRQPGLDWQIWIQLGEYPLPRRLVLTTLTDEARPQFEVTYNWNLAPSVSDDAFTFVPPAGASKVVLADNTDRGRN
jgi:hypothetical protein